MNYSGLRQSGLLIGCLVLSLPTLAQQLPDSEDGSQSAQTQHVQSTDDSTIEKPVSTPAILSVDANNADQQVSQGVEASSPAQINTESEQADAVIESAPPVPVLPHDLSSWGMFMQADWVVKAVMIGLILASIVTWTVLVAKTRELRVLVKRQKHTLAIVCEADSLQLAHQKLDNEKGSTQLIHAATDELQLSVTTLTDAEGVKERVASSLERLEAASGRNVTRGTSILATIGATAPFIGLFGTVWGIMNSFIGISKAQTTNLAVVAPGIAEALLATALGLVAAIPAVMIYNHFTRKIAAYKALIGDTSAAILRLVSRELSHFAVNGTRHPIGN